MYSFDSLDLLAPFPSEMSILSKHVVFISFIIHIGIYLRKLIDNICYFHEKNPNNYCRIMNFYRFN